jgi:hypothetical protein
VEEVPNRAVGDADVAVSVDQDPGSLVRDDRAAQAEGGVAFQVKVDAVGTDDEAMAAGGVPGFRDDVTAGADVAEIAGPPGSLRSLDQPA